MNSKSKKLQHKYAPEALGTALTEDQWNNYNILNSK